MVSYQTQTDPTKVVGRRIGAWIVDGLIAMVLIGAVFAATVDYDTLSADGARRVFGEENLCDAVEGGDFEGSNFCGPVDITLSRPGPRPDVVLTSRTIVFINDENYLIDPASGGVGWLVGLAYGVAVMWILQGLTGMTPGKAVFGIRTVNEEGTAPGLGKAFIRWLLWIVDALPYCTVVPLVGGIAAMASKGHRRVGDMAAKTYVIGKADMGRPVVLPGAAVMGAPGAFAPPPPAPMPTAPPVTPVFEPPETAGSEPGYAAPGAASDPGWAAPAEPPTEAGPGDATEVTSAPTPPAGAGDAQWDPQRNAYIMWDAPGERWLQFDDPTQEWKPIQ